MSWLWAYLGLGVLSLVIMLISHARQRPSESARQLLASLNGPLSTKDKILEKVVVPFLAGLAVLVAWPLALLMAIKQKQEQRQEARDKEDAKFKIRANDLLHKTTLADVEATTRIHDPQGAVPDLPFGHLHPVWQKFLAQSPAGAELWTFARDWQVARGHVRERAGYVWVLGDQRSPWMLTRDFFKENEDE